MKITAATLLGIIALAACFLAVPLLAATVGGWYAYWGAMVLSAIWAAILLWLKLTKYWGEN